MRTMNGYYTSTTDPGIAPHNTGTLTKTTLNPNRPESIRQKRTSESQRDSVTDPELNGLTKE